MQPVDFDQTIEGIVERDGRYHAEAYYFIREALDYTQKIRGKNKRKDSPQHVSGKELLAGIRDYALAEFGPMAMTVLEEWNIHQCKDFGELVFNMVDSGLLSKTKEDSRADFAGGYAFEEAFRKPFLASKKKARRPSKRVKVSL